MDEKSVVGQNDYLAQQQNKPPLLGSLSAYASIKGAVQDTRKLQASLVMSGKALASKTAEFSALVQKLGSVQI